MDKSDVLCSCTRSMRMQCCSSSRVPLGTPAPPISNILAEGASASCSSHTEVRLCHFTRVHHVASSAASASHALLVGRIRGWHKYVDASIGKKRLCEKGSPG